MNRILLFSMAVAISMVCGCASQTKNKLVGQAEGNSGYNDRMGSDDYYFHAPSVEIVIVSEPAGALVEWNNGRGQWITVGSTPMENVAIEATGKPELFRISQKGFVPQIRWVTTRADVEKVNIDIQLVKDLEASLEYLGTGN